MTRTDAEIGAMARALRLADELSDSELTKALQAVRPDLYQEAEAEANVEEQCRHNPHM